MRLAKRLGTHPKELAGEALDEWLALRLLLEDQQMAPGRWEKIEAGRARSFASPGGGLYHDFLLVDREQFGYEDYLKLIHSPEAVRIHEDLIHYMGDTLRWLPTLNPPVRGSAVPGHGLNWYGPTILEKDGAELLCGLLDGWKRVFAQAPDTFVLTGGYLVTVDGQATGGYARLVFSRDEVLWLLAEWRRLAGGVDERHYLLHLGV